MNYYICPIDLGDPVAGPYGWDKASRELNRWGHGFALTRGAERVVLKHFPTQNLAEVYAHNDAVLSGPLERPRCEEWGEVLP